MAAQTVELRFDNTDWALDSSDLSFQARPPNRARASEPSVLSQLRRLVLGALALEVLVLQVLGGAVVAQERPPVDLSAAAEPGFFSEHIGPILQRRCWACHGPLRQKGELRLDSRASLLIGGTRGAAIEPGDAEASLLVSAIRRDADLAMPPPRALEGFERELLEAWIQAGAVWPASEGIVRPTKVASRSVPRVELTIDPRDGPGSSVDRVDFNRDVRPILANHCFECHGPDEGTRQAGLRLDIEEIAKSELPSGRRAVVGGSLDQSQLVQRIAAADANDRMPPASFAKSLAPAQVQTLARWIQQGAEWQTHWSFVRPRRPEPRVVVADERAHNEWARNDIDRFVLAKLESRQITPSPEAGKATLLRRLSLDLNGLPPTLQDLESFLADSGPGAYERAVDRLLESERYGEHFARMWLDAARYADTNGYHIDNERFMWRWRDSLIDALNRNQPFDQMTIEQLAGDLLPDATLEQRIASGFHRNHMINFEGGAVPEEYRAQYVFDRTDTTATVWLGLTAGCAKCHDHKYDPLSQKEYYQLAAFFNTVDEKGLDGQRGNAEPLIPAPLPSQKKRLDELEQRLDPYESFLDGASAELEAAQADWQKAAFDELVAHWTLVAPDRVESTGGASFRSLADGSILVGGENPDRDVYEIYTTVEIDRLVAVGLEALTDPSLPKGGVGRSSENGSFVLTEIEIAVEDASSEDGFRDVSLGHAVANHEHRQLRLTNAFDGDPESGWSADYPARKGQRTAVFFVDQPVDLTALGSRRVRIRLRQESDYPQRTLGRFRLSLASAVTSSLARLGVGALDPDREIQFLLATDGEQQTEEQRDTLRRHYRRRHRPEWTPEREHSYVALTAKLEDLLEEIPTTMVMAEMEAPRPTFVLHRGEYDQAGEQVRADTPSFLPPLDAGVVPDRLGLARWLVDERNPLTARVTVNRLWQRLFGAGLVETSEDFGLQGELPSHPELLDWLAVELVESGWDTKALIKNMVLSSTYRQSSAARPELLELDPENRLLARGSRYRLEAEVIRDSALAISGLLVEKVGGRSVKPYQPAGLWREIGYESRGRYSASVFEPDHGASLYRRSLYTFWKRTVPPPNMMVFDAPNRETCVVRRSRSNTPLQALVLWNDPQFVEAARALAERMLESTDDTLSSIALGFRLATARSPREEESVVLAGLLEEQRAHYQLARSEASKLIGLGDSNPDPELDPSELAAWTVIASVLLNLDETLNRL